MESIEMKMKFFHQSSECYLKNLLQPNFIVISTNGETEIHLKLSDQNMVIISVTAGVAMSL